MFTMLDLLTETAYVYKVSIEVNMHCFFFFFIIYQIYCDTGAELVSSRDE